MGTESGQSHLQLMELHINTLFRGDPDERLRIVNELDEPPAPRFYMGRTQMGNRWRFRYDLPVDVVQQLERLCQAEPVAADLTSLPPAPARVSDPFTYLAAVVRGVENVEPGNLWSLENALSVVKILDAARVSAREGKTVRLG